MTTTLAQSDAEPVRPAWAEPDENNEGKYVLCVETPAQVEMFEMGAKHFADALANAINEHVKLHAAPPRPDASAGLIEAAEMAHAKWMKLRDPEACADMWEFYNEIRARAAERSGK